MPFPLDGDQVTSPKGATVSNDQNSTVNRRGPIALYRKDMIRSDYDIILTILRTLKELPFRTSIHHVKGDQDSRNNPPFP